MRSAGVKATLLVDNTAGAGLAPEHGFSVWLETPGLSVLFDTGQGPALHANAARLGVSPGACRFVVLSHGHYDHTGGLPLVLGRPSRATLVCHPGACVPRFSLRDGTAKPIGMPPGAMAALARLDDRSVRWAAGPMMLSDTVGVTGPIPRNNEFEDAGGPFFLDQAGTRPDPIADEIALWVSTVGGLVIITGCCHAGIGNTLSCVTHLARTRRIRAVIGGLHLGAATPCRLERTVEVLRVHRPGQLVACHCTGGAAADFLRGSLESPVVTGRSGMVLEF